MYCGVITYVLIVIKQINNTMTGKGEMETLLYTTYEVMYCYLKGECDK